MMSFVAMNIVQAGKAQHQHYGAIAAGFMQTSSQNGIRLPVLVYLFTIQIHRMNFNGMKIMR